MSDMAIFPPGQTPTKVPRLELTIEMEGYLNFLLHLSFLNLQQSKVLNSGTNILISCHLPVICLTGVR